jgi:protein-L-isoaspartate(D-aspartate) O-methyltransferase
VLRRVFTAKARPLTLGGFLALLALVPRLALGAGATGGRDEAPELTQARQRMVNEQVRRRGVRDPCVLDALAHVPRHRFIPAGRVSQAYDDRAVPIGSGQTISQPYMVAYMTEALRLGGKERVLEIGTGSGYQAAVLARCAATVFTVEIEPGLAASAIARLESLGYGNVFVRIGDGWEGWAAHAPYDAVMVTAAGPVIPPALVNQLREGGTLVMPKGKAGAKQVLIRGVKKGDDLAITELLPVAFVPLVGGPKRTDP